MSDKAAPAQLVEFTLIPKGTLIRPETALSIEQAFAPYVEQFKELSAHVSTITDPKEAKVTRLKLRKVRTDTDKKHQELKAESLAYGRTLDHCKNLINAQIEPIEEKLEAIEKAEERRIATLLAERRQQHLAALAPYLDPTLPAPFVDGITDSQFATILENVKMLHQAKIERERKEQEERTRLERAAAEERERLRVENERLQREARELEEAARVEREKAEAEKKAAEAKHAQERAEAEKKAKAERDAIEAKAKKEREAAEVKRVAELKKAEAKFAAERAETERKAEYDRQVEAARQKELDEKARREREELEQKAKAERAKREELERRAAEEKAAKEKLEREKQEAADKAAAAPDREKILAFCKAVLAPPLPDVKGAKAKRMVKDTAGEVQAQINMLETLAKKL